MKKLIFASLIGILLCGCNPEQQNTQPKSVTGIRQAKAEVPVNDKGHSIEQENIISRYKLDNTIGSIKHLYVISPMSGQVLIYSTVQGKVTSSGKRLTPKTISSDDGEFVNSDFHGIPVAVNGYWHRTTEVIQDDGTYGDSIEYLYWFDTKGNYHQHYVSGCMVHISDQPLPIKNVVLNLEQVEE